MRCSVWMAALPKRFAIIGVGCATTVAVASSSINAQANFSWEGTFRVGSLLCTSPENGSDCSDVFNESLEVRKKGEDYLVTPESTQANQHVCAFSFLMKEAGRHLIYETAHGRVRMIRTDAALIISSRNVDPTALGLGICGAHADIDGLVFPWSSKRRAE